MQANQSNKATVDSDHGRKKGDLSSSTFCAAVKYLTSQQEVKGVLDDESQELEEVIRVGLAFKQAESMALSGKAEDNKNLKRIAKKYKASLIKKPEVVKGINNFNKETIEALKQINHTPESLNNLSAREKGKILNTVRSYVKFNKLKVQSA